MPVSELDRWRAAQQLIENYGGDAQMQAAHRADQAIKQKDAEGEVLWSDVLTKIRSLQQSTGPGPLN